LPAIDVAWTRNRVCPRRLAVEALERLVHDAAEPQRVTLLLQANRLQLVVDEPAVRASDPTLERARADAVPVAKRRQHRLCDERPRKVLLGGVDVAADRAGAGELALGRRLRWSGHHPLEPTGALQVVLGRLGIRREKV